jgi:hypothetical protein
VRVQRGDVVLFLRNEHRARVRLSLDFAQSLVARRVRLGDALEHGAKRLACDVLAAVAKRHERLASHD